MEFEQSGHFWEVKIGDVWYILISCRNCKSISASHREFSFHAVDKKINCCDNPDNFTYGFGSKERITKFIEKWS